MNIPWLPTESRLVDRCGVGNDSQLVLLNVGPVLVEGTFAPSHDISYRSRMNRQDRRAQDHGQRVGTVGVGWVVQKDGELMPEN